MKEKRDPKTQLGIVTRILSEGFGWIHGDDEEEYFFHAKSVRGDGFDDREKFFEGARVRFIATDSPKGPRALNVVALAGERAEVDGNRAELAVVRPEEEDPRG